MADLRSRGAWRPMSDAGQWMEIAYALSDADRMIHEIVAVTQGVVRGHSGRVAILDAL